MVLSQVLLLNCQCSREIVEEFLNLVKSSIEVANVDEALRIFT